MIKVEQVSKSFGKKKVLHNISFEVKKGEILGFLGPNAAGKTTTMRIITGFMPSSEGYVEVAGNNVFDKPLEAKKHIGYLPETPPLYPEMNVRKYLEFIARIKGIPGGELPGWIDEVMEQVNITHVQERLTGRLSKGYRQRVGLAQALIHKPPVLILDEPTSGLDPKQIIEVRDLIKSLAGEHTIILSTHILSEVSMTCERVIIIDKGRLVAQDTPGELTRKLKGVEKLMVEVEGPREEVLSTIRNLPGVTAAELHSTRSESRNDFIVETQVDIDVRSELSGKVAENNWGLYELRSIGMSLEEIFLQLTTREQEEHS